MSVAYITASICEFLNLNIESFLGNIVQFIVTVFSMLLFKILFIVIPIFLLIIIDYVFSLIESAIKFIYKKINRILMWKYIYSRINIYWYIN